MADFLGFIFLVVGVIMISRMIDGYRKAHKQLKKEETIKTITKQRLGTIPINIYKYSREFDNKRYKLSSMRGLKDLLNSENKNISVELYSNKVKVIIDGKSKEYLVIESDVKNETVILKSLECSIVVDSKCTMIEDFSDGSITLYSINYVEEIKLRENLGIL